MDSTSASRESTIWQDVMVQYNKQLNCMAVDCRGALAALGGKKGVYIVDLEEPWEFARSLYYSSSSSASGGSGVRSSSGVGEVQVLAWNPHLERSHILAAAAGKETMLFHMDDRRAAMHVSLQTHQRPVADLSWSLSDPNVLASCSADTYINLWDCRDTRRPTRLKSMCGWTAPVQQVRFNRRHPFLLASAHDAEVRLWDIRRESQPLSKMVSAHAAPITQLDWSPSLSSSQLWLLTASMDRSVKVWGVYPASGTGGYEEPATPSSLSLVASYSFTQPVGKARFVPLGGSAVSIVASAQRGGDYSIKLLALSESPVTSQSSFQLNEIHSFIGHADAPSSLDWRVTSPIHPLSDSGSTSTPGSGLQLASWSARDQQLRLWCIPQSIQQKLKAVPVVAAVPSMAASTLPQPTSLGSPPNAHSSQYLHSLLQSNASLQPARPAPRLPQLLSPLPLSLTNTPSSSLTPTPSVLIGVPAPPASPGPGAQIINTLADWELASSGSTTMEQELSLLARLNIISQALPTLTPAPLTASASPQQWLSVTVEDVAAAKRCAVITASVSQAFDSEQGGWCQSSEAHPYLTHSHQMPPLHAALKIRLVFPSLYPHSASPSIEIQSLLVNHVNVLPHNPGSSSAAATPSASPSPSPSASFLTPLPSVSPSPSSFGIVPPTWSSSAVLPLISELKESWAATNMTAVDIGRTCFFPLIKDSVSFLRRLLLRWSSVPPSRSHSPAPTSVAPSLGSVETSNAFTLHAPRPISLRKVDPPVPIDLDGRLTATAPVISASTTPNLDLNSNPTIVAAPLAEPVEDTAPASVGATDARDTPTELSPNETSSAVVVDSSGFTPSASEISSLSHRVAISLNSTSSYGPDSPLPVNNAASSSEVQDSLVPKKIANLDSVQRAAPAVMVSSARGAALPDTISLEFNASQMPAPRWCGATWGSMGILLIWGRVGSSKSLAGIQSESHDVARPPNSRFRLPPKTFPLFLGWKADVLARSRQVSLRKQQHARELERLRHEAETPEPIKHTQTQPEVSTGLSTASGEFDEDEAASWNSRTTLVDASLLLPVSPFLARSYRLYGHLSLSRVCAENANLARLVGRADLVRAWSLLALQNNSQLEGLSSWHGHPLGQKLVRELAKHFEQMGDVQMLAMMSCILAGPLPEPKTAIALSRTAISAEHKAKRLQHMREQLAILGRQHARERQNLLVRHFKQRAKVRQQLTLLSSTNSSSLAASSGTLAAYQNALAQLKVIQNRQLLQQELQAREHCRQRQELLSRYNTSYTSPSFQRMQTHLLPPDDLQELLKPRARVSAGIDEMNRQSRLSKYLRLASQSGSHSAFLHRNHRMYRFLRVSPSLARPFSFVSKSMWIQAIQTTTTNVIQSTRAMIPRLSHSEPEQLVLPELPLEFSSKTISLDSNSAEFNIDSYLSSVPKPHLSSFIDQEDTEDTVVKSVAKFPLIDPYDMLRFDTFKQQYADILLQWGLLQERAQVLKCLTSNDARSQHSGPIFGVICRKCNTEVPNGPVCRHCATAAFECSLCRLPVRGTSLYCMSCGHGGHSLHIREWFAFESVCPTGCGCQCQISENTGTALLDIHV